MLIITPTGDEVVIKGGNALRMVKRIKCGNANCYLVSDGASGILIDTGKKKYLDVVIEACKPYKMKLIVLTHAHFDHAENAADLSEMLSAPIAIHKDDADLIESNNNQYMSAQSLTVQLCTFFPV